MKEERGKQECQGTKKLKSTQRTAGQERILEKHHYFAFRLVDLSFKLISSVSLRSNTLQSGDYTGEANTAFKQNDYEFNTSKQLYSFILISNTELRLTGGSVSANS